MRIARVFPRRTVASPTDELAFFGDPPELIPLVDEVHISVAFTYDLIKADEMAKAWDIVAPVKVGGPATGDRGGDFVPTMYIRDGYTITSRGCPNKCWFCDVWKREGKTRELPIVDGWNLLDSNLLACSDQHIKRVFSMLERQDCRAQLTGGLEAARLRWWHVRLLWDLLPQQIFFAYDTPDDLDPLIEAGRMLRLANFTRSHLRCYVLIGFLGDTFEKAQKRLLQAWEAGFLPCAMLWKNKEGSTDKEWGKFQRLWARPAITKKVVQDLLS